MDQSIADVSQHLQQRLIAIRGRAARLSPMDMHAAMDAIRSEADRGGLHAMAGLAAMSAQLALLPGCRITTGICLDHAGDALAASTRAEEEAVLAAVAARLH